MNYILNDIKIDVHVLYLGSSVCETLLYYCKKKKQKKKQVFQ